MLQQIAEKDAFLHLIANKIQFYVWFICDTYPIYFLEHFNKTDFNQLKRLQLSYPLFLTV